MMRGKGWKLMSVRDSKSVAKHYLSGWEDMLMGDVLLLSSTERSGEEEVQICNLMETLRKTPKHRLVAAQSLEESDSMEVRVLIISV